MAYSRSWVVIALCCSAAYGESVLDAVKSGDSEAAEKLLKQDRASANSADPDGTTALHWAVRANDVATVRALLAAGANASAANRYALTPLSLAAANGNAEIAELLIKARADAKAVQNEGQTLLMTAARSGDPKIVRMLVEHGADVNAREQSLGQTALMWAAAGDHPEAVKILVEHDAEVDARSTLLEFPKDRFGLEGVTTVLPRGDWTALMYAARDGAVQGAEALVNAGASLNLTDPDGTTALVLAIMNGHFDTASMLVSHGADPNIADSTGMAALFAAVDMNTLGEIYGRPPRKPHGKTTALELIEQLLDHGAEVNATLKSTTLFRAHTPGEPVFGEGTTPLMRAARNADIDGMKLLLDRGANLESKQKNGTTALMLASGVGRGTGVFAKDYATEAQMLEAVKFLIDRGADVNATTVDGQTALHASAQASDPVVEYLALHGAKLDAKDSKGRTPLDTAGGAGLRRRINGDPLARQSTVALLERLMRERGIPIEPAPQK